MESNSSWDFSAVGNNSSAGSSSARPAADPASPFQRRPQSTKEPNSSRSGTDGTASSADPASSPSSSAKDRTGRRRHYGPRTCRICLDVVQPQFPDLGTTFFGLSAPSSKPTYVSDDPQQGRLFSPCKCKGSQKYVHEGCLDAWRATNLSSDRNFWHCPTCKFTYRLTRLHWASMLSSRVAQIVLTVFVMALGIFILGYIADPVMDLWFDPVGTISDTVTDIFTDIEGLRVDHTEPSTWIEHWTKGFFSLGIVGMVQSFINSPWTWWSFRVGGGGGIGGARRQGTGRSRYENMNLLFILLGAFTFMMATWRFVKALSARVLQRVSERVMDVGDDEDEDDDDETGGPSTSG